MAKSDSEKIAEIALFGVGLWFLGQLLKNHGHIQTYRCGNCNGMIRPNDISCPWCRTQIQWNEVR